MVADIQPSRAEPERVATAPRPASGPLHALWHWDPATDRLTLSTDAARALGCDPGAPPATLQELLERIAPEQRPEVAATLAAARDQGSGFSLQIACSGAGDAATVCTLTGMAVNGQAGTALCGTLAPEPAAGATVSVAQLGALLHERSNDGVLVIDGDGCCRQANRAALRLLDIDDSRLQGAPLHELLDLAPDTFAGNGDKAPSSSPRRCTRRDADGRDITLELQPLGQAERGLRVYVLRDISERRDAEKMHALLSAIVGSSEDAIVGKDLNGVIQFWNSSATRLFGYRPEEAIGRRVTMLIPADRQSEEDHILARLRRGERVEHFETVRCTKDGRLLDISLCISPIIDASGTIIGASKIARDITPQKKAEEALRSNRQMLNTVVEAAPVAVAVINGDGLVQLWNSAAARLFGWSEAEITAPLAPGPASAQREQLLATLRRTAIGDTVAGVETVVSRKDGSPAEISLWTAPLEGARGEAPRTLFIAADIGERRRTQRILREQEQRLRTALHASRTGTFRWDIRSHELSWDENLDRLFGLAPGESVRSIEQFIERVHPEDRSAVLTAVQRCAEKGSDFELDFRVVWPDGSVHWLYDVGQTFIDEHGSPQYMTGACVDITQRKQAEQALRDSEQRFRTLADNIAQFAWMADGTGWIFWYNQRWFDYTGTTLEQMQGWGWRQVHHPEHVDRVVKKVSRCFATGEVWEDTFPLRAADGSYRWFLSRAVPIRDSEGNVTRWLGTNTDITELRDMEEALREADRRKDAFLATLAHELRNPLAPILNGLELLRLGVADAGTGQRVRDSMARQANHLVRLVDDLLEVSRISRNKVQLRREHIVLQDVVASAVETVQPTIDQQGHDLTLDLPAEAVTVYADFTRLAQIFANLLNNAAKYTEPGGRIEVQAERAGEQVRVRIRDNGCGIEAHMLEHIFDMFIQTASPDAGRGGLGIGLTLVKSLVEMHGGSVRATSAGLGQGSEFVLTLPATPPPAQTHADTTSDQANMTSNSQQRILVVDDNEDAAVSTTMLLEAMGHEVRTAYDGIEAISLAADFLPQVVLLDLGMPKLNGYETARRLRQEPWGRDMILIALTGWGQEQDRQRTQDAGFNRHLVKPVDPSALRSLLEELADAGGQHGAG